MTDHASLHELAMAELRKNRETFNGMRQDLERDHSGRIALLHDGKLVSIFNDRGDAYVIGYGAGTARLTVTLFFWVKLSSMPSRENSRPIPLCLTPP